MHPTPVLHLHGMEKLLKGVIKYRNTFKGKMVKQFKQVRDNPQPTAVFFTCVDSRMLPTRFTQTNVGDMFIVRNVGNIIPHFGTVDTTSTSTEPAALELGCVVNSIGHVIVCGHSDCKAMNLLYTRYKNEQWTEKELLMSPIRAWLSRHGMNSLRHYEALDRNHFRTPLELKTDSQGGTCQAYIDVDQEFNETDKLSQIHVLLQMENVSTYPFLQNVLRDGKTRVHALWFDIYTGEIYFFSRSRKHFIRINEDNYMALLDELDDPKREILAEEILQEAKIQMEEHRECKDHTH